MHHSPTDADQVRLDCQEFAVDKTASHHQLRIHRGDDPAPESSINASTNSQRFWQAFSAATGWRVDSSHPTSPQPNPADPEKRQPLKVLPAVAMDVMADHPLDAMPPVEKASAAELAEIAHDMAGEIETLQSHVRKRELELAAMAVAPYSTSDVDETCQSIEDTLRDATLALRFDAAAIYVLDDDTQFLNTRVVFGLPDDRLTAEPRPLRGSRGDLEAMVQEVVLIEDLQNDSGATWCAPEQAGSAICAAIYKGDLPIGTLWLYSNSRRPLDRSHAAIARMAAKQVALNLTAAVQSRAQLSSKQATEAVADIAAWQYSSLPANNDVADGWYVDAMIESPDRWSTGWHAWDVLPDGTVMVAIAEAVDTHANGAMAAATARAALTAHSGYRHSPRQMLQRISDTLWQSNTADQLVSLMYIRLDPESGEGEVAVSGQIEGMIAGSYGYRPLVASGCRPLASAIDIDCFESTFKLSVGEKLLAYTAGLRKDGIGQDLVGCCLRHSDGDAKDPLAMLRREIADFPVRNERGVLLLARRS
ncbi:GAF domain-containing protein [Roseiconus lacunae]|uniref:GAF domain-containing protein n=1 Tax=Roseiconus lacunae TaxID=2605694 RepID=UPI0011F0BEEB|nr:GAF domain-containing protein [Roseiconus lacunae]